MLGERSFEGGAHLPIEPLDEEPIRALPAPRRLALALRAFRHADDEPFDQASRTMRPLVEPGELVSTGDPVARAAGPGMPVIHAPLGGRVTGLCRVDTVRDSDLPALSIEVSADLRNTETDAPVIESTASVSRPAVNAIDLWCTRQVERLELDALAGRADECGVLNGPECDAGLGQALREAAALSIREVIVNGLQPEPMRTGTRRVLRERLGETIAAGLAVQEALRAKRLWLAVDGTDRRLVGACRSAVLGTSARLVTLANKYPQAAAPLLAWTVSGRETPYGSRPVNVGVLVLQAETLADLWAALADRSPATHRVVAVGGPAALRPGHYRVPAGTSYGDLVEGVGLRRPLVRLIDGGPLTGRCVESLEAVITPATSAVLLIDRDSDAIPAPGPCIRCGACQEDCPVGLDPKRLLEAFELGRPGEAAALFSGACVACGLCSYVCPAELPLAPAAVALKRTTALE